MKLSNPPCRKAKRCLPFCGICNLQGEPRLITNESLFGVCRTVGKCICKNWSDTQNCYWINSRNKTEKPILASSYDCSPKEHPHHHYITLSRDDLEPGLQAEINKKVHGATTKYKEQRGMWSGAYLWSKK